MSPEEFKEASGAMEKLGRNMANAKEERVVKALTGEEPVAPKGPPPPELSVGVFNDKVRLLLSVKGEKGFDAHFDFKPEEAGQFAHMLVQCGRAIMDRQAPKLEAPIRKLVLPGQ